MFANNGFFAIDHSSTLKLLNGPPMLFYDVYWTTDDLSAEEKREWYEHNKETASNLIGFLPKSFHELPVVCPHCKRSTSANNYDGAWYEARCKACMQTFKPTGWALLRSLYESNYS